SPPCLPLTGMTKPTPRPPRQSEASRSRVSSRARLHAPLWPLGSAANSVLADGKILIGGSFTVLNGKTHNRIGRLNADGTLDSAFDPSANGLVLGFAPQTDGRILLGGSFSTLNDLPRSFLGRLDADGTVDPLFNPGSSSSVLGKALQP